MRSIILQRLAALVLSVVLLAQSGVYPAAVALVEKVSGTHRVDVNWSHQHATVSLRHSEGSAQHHHGLPEKLFLLNASDGNHPDHVLSSDAPQSKSTTEDPHVDRADVLLVELILPSHDTQSANPSLAQRNHALTVADTRCPEQTEVMRTVSLLV